MFIDTYDTEYPDSATKMIPIIIVMKQKTAVAPVG